MGNVATAVKAEAINSLAINAGKDFQVPMRSVPSGRDLQKNFSQKDPTCAQLERKIRGW